MHDHWLCEPCDRLAGTLQPPGDKSISHRVLMLAALADGDSTVAGFLESADCLGTLAALVQLGAEIRPRDGTLRIRGVAGRPRSPREALDCGNSGTAMRLLAGLLAGFPLRCELTGDASLRRRPMDRILEPLARMGATVAALGGEGRAPLRIDGGGLRGITYGLPVASAQVKSCLLLAGMCARGMTRLAEPGASRDHTERLFRFLGLPIGRADEWITLEGADGPPVIPPAAYTVPGDFSSAAFWMAAAACRPGTRLRMVNVGVNPCRARLLDVLARMGAAVALEDERDCNGEPCAGVVVEGRDLIATDVAGAEIPGLIDELPVLCVVAANARGITRIRDAAELRVKETDRIQAMAALLAAFGVRCEPRADGMDVHGSPGRLRGHVCVDSLGDHRVAMSAAILALRADGPVRIDHVACVSTSYPGFWDDRRRLCRPEP